jgi:hypothetical protein
MASCLAARGSEEAWTFDYADCVEREARRGQCRLMTRCWNPLLPAAANGTLCARVAGANGTDNGSGEGAGPSSTAGAPSSLHIQVNWQTLLSFFVFTALAIVGLVLLVIRIGGRLIAGEVVASFHLSEQQQQQQQQQQQHRRSSSDEMQQSVSHHLYVPLTAGDE